MPPTHRWHSGLVVCYVQWALGSRQQSSWNWHQDTYSTASKVMRAVVVRSRWILHKPGSRSLAYHWPIAKRSGAYVPWCVHSKDAVRGLMSSKVKVPMCKTWKYWFVKFYKCNSFTTAKISLCNCSTTCKIILDKSSLYCFTNLYLLFFQKGTSQASSSAVNCRA